MFADRRLLGEAPWRGAAVTARLGADLFAEGDRP
jgi:hypothetical protein